MDEIERKFRMLHAAVAAAYSACVHHPHDGWRAMNQPLYCILRDVLADVRGVDPNEIQDEFEAELHTWFGRDVGEDDG